MQIKTWKAVNNQVHKSLIRQNRQTAAFPYQFSIFPFFGITYELFVIQIIKDPEPSQPDPVWTVPRPPRPGYTVGMGSKNEPILTRLQQQRDLNKKNLKWASILSPAQDRIPCICGPTSSTAQKSGWPANKKVNPILLSSSSPSPVLFCIRLVHRGPLQRAQHEFARAASLWATVASPSSSDRYHAASNPVRPASKKCHPTFAFRVFPHRAFLYKLSLHGRVAWSRSVVVDGGRE